MLPSKLTEIFDKEKLAVACPNGKVYQLSEKVAMQFLQHYNLAETPLQIGFLHTETQNGEEIQTIAPKLTWNVTVE